MKSPNHIPKLKQYPETGEFYDRQEVKVEAARKRYRDRRELAKEARARLRAEKAKRGEK